MKAVERLTAGKKRLAAGLLAAALAVLGSGSPFSMKAQASDVWPQKATAPFYCLDGGKSWRTADRYGNYKYDTLPAPLTEVQAKRLFWGYPANWAALKKAAAKYDPNLYAQIASTASGPNTVKYIKDDPGTKFAWVADQEEIEARAVLAMERASLEGAAAGKEAPEAIREATTEEKAVPFQVLPFSDGPGALDTEFHLGSEFIRDIARIEPQSVWDNGSTGGNVGWLDASQDKNIAKSVMGENLYEVTWSGDSIKIHNNGSAAANENAVGSTMSDEEKYNKTMVRYKITMRGGSGWYTEGSWNEDYLHEWMEFKACVNAPDHQRLYKADIRITPSDQVFYIVISQDGDDEWKRPEHGGGTPRLSFQIFRHEETFQANYHVRLKKFDEETGMPLKGSRFYLYERFEDAAALGEREAAAGLSKANVSFRPWEGFQVFAEGTTDGKGEITHTDTRRYCYSKTYCDGHTVPEWGEEADGGDSEDEEEAETSGESEETRDANRAAARKWLELVSACEEEAEGGTHFHWLADENAVQQVMEVLESGSPSDGGSAGAGREQAFEASGCKADCEESYEKFINLRFTYTWKEVQARPGYILHGLHADDKPIEIVTTNSSEAGARSVFAAGSSDEIKEDVWYAGNMDRDGGQERRLRKNLLREQEEQPKRAAEGIFAFRLARVDADPPREPAAAESGIKKAKGRDAAVLHASQSRLSAAAFRPGREMSATASNAGRSGPPATNFDVSQSGPPPTASNAGGAGLFATASNAKGEAEYPGGLLRLSDQRMSDADETDDEEWEEGAGSSEFQDYLGQASPDGLRHLKAQDPGKFSHCNGEEDCGESWRVYDHRTEGRLHINKRDLDLYRKESDVYSAYGETEGDATLEGAVYGLFAAEDILHPDTELGSSGKLSNTGIVYRKNDLTAVAVTDADGNADFLAYTKGPGMTYDYGSGKIRKRTDIKWDGPGNRYQENREKNGNEWVGRPLLLGSYYVKELSRSEGFELSVNGLFGKQTNYGTGFETPKNITASSGLAAVTLTELFASMEGEDGGGRGYDELPFSVTSTGTLGYELLVSGLPAGTDFYRVDSGEAEVTGPHVTGSEERQVTDAAGNPVWKRAESDTSHVKYEPEFGEEGAIIGQLPVSRIEDQIIKAERIPEKKRMRLEQTETDAEEELLMEVLGEHAILDDSDEVFRFVKAAVEEILNRNGYEIPVMADGSCSQRDLPVYSRGVRKGEPDRYGQTTKVGEPALRTVYGAATATLTPETIGPGSTAGELIAEILGWYQTHPEWSFGGIDSIEREGQGYRIVLYAGASVKDSRRFFIRKEDSRQLEVEKIYAVYENPVKLQWMYQAYEANGRYRYEVERRYYMGSGGEKRYYIDAVLTPAMLVNTQGELEAVRHTVMICHRAGEEIIDYLTGVPGEHYRVPETETVDTVEVTTETELVEADVLLKEVTYDPKTGVYRIRVATEGTDRFGNAFSDRSESLTLRFSAKLPKKRICLSEEDIASLGAGNTAGYRAGEEIGFAKYLLRFAKATFSASTAKGSDKADTYIVTRTLSYRGQNYISEDGDTKKLPLQLLERPVKQKIEVIKRLSDETVLDHFRFKLYLKSNLERLYCDADGTIRWIDKNGTEIDQTAYRDTFPELVAVLDTKKTGRRLLETVTQREEDKAGGSGQTTVYNYEKFFDAMRTADTDRWHNGGGAVNTSFKPFAFSRYEGVKNTINSSAAAEENAKRSDAVRQFAVTWYLEEAVADCKAAGGEEAAYADELYDRALYAAILKAEEYLMPFFRYDLDSLYEIRWDSEADGGIDKDPSTLAADRFKKDGAGEYAYGISPYLPYGDYVLAEQQPCNPRFLDFPNRHYAIDAPKELSLPAVYEEREAKLSSFYWYNKEDSPNELAEKYLLRFNEEWADTYTEPLWDYVILAHSHDGDFELFPYGLSAKREREHCSPYKNQTVAGYYHYRLRSENASSEAGTAAMNGQRTAFDGRYAPMLVPWSVTETRAESTAKHTGCAQSGFLNRPYRVRLRIEKLDMETGEPILHDDAVFALYRAERNEKRDGDGSVKRYEKPAMLSGSREFLEAMGAKQIVPFARGIPLLGAGELFSGIVPAGTPVCREADAVIFSDRQGVQTGSFEALSTVTDEENGLLLQTTGYLETPEPVDAGVYVLAELKAPAGYVRSLPVPVEIYSDAVSYYPDGGEEKAAAVLYSRRLQTEGEGQKGAVQTARIYVKNTATSLETDKRKTGDTYRGMKVSGRVEGTITLLGIEYGLENLELAYNSAGQYMGFGWKKGTLEYLESRKAAGERMELVYENGVFQGYGYITRTLGTAEDENRHVPGAVMALYEAIELRAGGDSGDYMFEGLEVRRDRNGNVKEIFVKEGFAGQRTEFVQEDGLWKVQTVRRRDTPVLFYDLGGLKVLERDSQGSPFGYDREGRRIRITADTDSIYALRSGRPVFEISGGDFSELVYDSRSKAFRKLDEATAIYHLDQDLCRDAQVDGFTGLAYVEKSDPERAEKGRYYVWPVTVSRRADGTVYAREKILTGRPGEIHAGTENAYMTGSWNAKEHRFEKRMRPVYDVFGMVQYYERSEDSYEKGRNIYDRDGDYVRYRYDDLLELYNRAAYTIQEHGTLYSEENTEDFLLRHRFGEAYLLANVWTSGETTPQDGTDDGQTAGRADRLRRVVPGCYILEELYAPAGYVKAMPAAVCVTEREEIQRVAMTDERIKVEFSKVDAAGGRQLPGVKLALYRAERIPSMDFAAYPKGYYLIKAEEKPAVWIVDNPVDNSLFSTNGLWITDEKPRYFEGIPAGDYILEELETPKGYVPASMELTIKPTEKLQSFILQNEPVKLEIFKYERKGQEKQALPQGYTAELSLYPADVDADGGYTYDAMRPIDTWRSGGLSAYASGIKEAYEAMFAEYKGDFRELSWQEGEGKLAVDRHAVRKETYSSGRQEIVTQLWETDENEIIRIRAVQNDGRAGLNADGQPRTSFTYQFHYKEALCEEYPAAVSYETGDGVHRIDGLSPGCYVLAETQTPAGYEAAAPMLIRVTKTKQIQRYEMENKKKEKEPLTGRLVIEKRDGLQKDKKLCGAWFEAENLQTGERVRTATDENGTAVFEGLPVGEFDENEDMIRYEYEVQEVRPPEGYQLSESRWRVRFDGLGQTEPCYTIRAENKETEFLFSKSSFQTGHFVAGAKLSIYPARTENGLFVREDKVVETWVSDEKPHCVTGRLAAGRTYFLVEEEAPAGYAAALPVRFTVSPDGQSLLFITDQSQTIHAVYEEGKPGIRALSVSVRSAVRMNYILLSGERELARWQGTGQEKRITEETAEDGELLTLCEQVEFSDGSVLFSGRRTFRLRFGENGNASFLERLPVKHQFALKTEDGKTLFYWDGSADLTEHRIENVKKADGTLLFTPGAAFLLEESLWFSDGSRLPAKKTTLTIHENGEIIQTDLKDRETRVWISKNDMTDGEELEGAALALYDQNGTVVEQWISTDSPHVFEARLTAGERYTLKEELAPKGYETAEEISFTVSEYGEIERVVMEDKRKEPPEEPEPETKPEPKEPEETEPETEPTPVPEKPDEPKLRYPTKTVHVKTKPQEPEPQPERKQGILWASYKADKKAEGILHLRQKNRLYLRLPKTGDERRPGLYLFGLAISLLVLLGSLWIRRRQDEK